MCLIRSGVIDLEMMDKEKITMQELEKSLREQGVLDVKSVYLAVLETSGKISVIKKEDARAKGRFKYSFKRLFKRKTL